LIPFVLSLSKQERNPLNQRFLKEALSKPSPRREREFHPSPCRRRAGDEGAGTFTSHSNCAHKTFKTCSKDFSVRPELAEACPELAEGGGGAHKYKLLKVKPLMVRQAHHERLNLMAVALQTTHYMIPAGDLR
jgi:hypothetical protein